VSPRCVHGFYVDECPTCLIADSEVEGETLATARLEDTAPANPQVSSETVVLVSGFWQDGDHYQLCAAPDWLEIHHLSVDGVRLPAAIFWRMVETLEGEGARP